MDEPQLEQPSLFSRIFSNLKKYSNFILDNKFTILTVLGLIAFVSLFFYFNSTSHNNIFYDYQYYTNIAIIVIILVAIIANVVTFKNAEQGESDGSGRLKNLTTSILYSAIGFGLLISVAVGLYYVLKNQDANYFMNFIFALAGVLALLGGAYYFLKSNNLLPIGLMSRIFTSGKTLLFLIPLYLSKGVNAIAQELKITPKYVYLLLVAEILFVLVYFGLPMLFKYFIDYTYGGKILTDDTYFLNRQRNLANYIDLEGNPSSSDKEYNYNYAIHGWFFLHQRNVTHTDENVFSSIINYGNKPNIEYNADTNTIRISALKGDQPKPVKVFESNTIQLQKWNNIVINYGGSSLDVFINGALVHSEPGMMPYYKYDSITIGDENGVSGGITNVIYFKQPLSKWFIQTNYKLLKNKAIPKY